MFTLKKNISISVFFDGPKDNPAWPSESVANKKPSEAIETVDKTKLDALTKEMLEEFLWGKNRSEATELLKKWKEKIKSQNNDPKILEALEKRERTLLVWSNYNSGLFGSSPDGERKEISREFKETLTNALGIPEKIEESKEEKQKIRDFREAHPIDKYIEEIIQYALEHPKRLENQIRGTPEWQGVDNFFESRVKELASFWEHPWLKQYHAVIDTIKVLVKTTQFDNDTGKISKFFRKLEWDGYEAKFYPSYLRQTLLDASVQKKVPESANKESIFDWLTKEQEWYLGENPPDKLYNDFLDYLKKWSGITPQDAQGYIKKQEDGVTEILNINENSPIAQIYKKKFQQMRAMSTYDILYDQNIWSKLKGAVTGNNLDAFLVEAQKWESTPGSVGYDGNGKFKFFPTWEMKNSIMKDGEISGECDSAWGAYIKWVNGNYGELKKIFWEDGMDALAIYLKNKNYNSSILDDNEWFKSFIEWEVPTENEFNNSESTNEWNEVLSIEKDFPALNTIIKNHPDKFNAITEIPKAPNGGIDGLKLIFQLIEGKNATPEIIKEMQIALITDLNTHIAHANEKHAEAITEVQKEHKEWKSAFEDLGISTKISVKDGAGKEEIRDIGALPVTHNFTDDNEIHAILSVLQKREWELTNSPEDNKKKTLIENLIEILKQKREVNDATVAKDAMSTTSANDILNASKEWEDAQIWLSETGTQNAHSQMIQKNARENREKEWVSIDLYREYGLPSDFWELTKPGNLNAIEKAISTLNSKENRGHDENIFLAQLRNARDQIKADAQAVRATMELQKSYPEFQNTISNIREWSKELYQNLSEKDIQRYTYISEFWDNSHAIGNMEMTLARMPPGESISLSKVIPELWDSFASDCNIIKSENPIYCNIDFPADSGIPTAVDIPIKSIKSYTSQVELFAKCNLQSLIGLIPSLDRNITNITGKKTSAISDGTFDEWEARRNMEFISRLLLGNYEKNLSLNEMARKITSQYPSPRDVQSKLIEFSILRREWWFNEFALQEKIWSLMKQA